jgi:uncharacterized protein (DUF488 family)
MAYIERRIIEPMRQPIFDVYSLGHSTHSQERFSALLKIAGVNAIADVRSSPFSRHFPHFSQIQLRTRLRQDGISYVFLGKELGGRPDSQSLFRDGVADYEAMAATKAFVEGLDRLINGAAIHRIAMMCSEHDPLDCHRCLLVARRLSERGLKVGHILPQGEVASHQQTEERLLKLEGFGAEDLFLSRQERLANAYRQRNMKIAYSENLLSTAVG